MKTIQTNNKELLLFKVPIKVGNKFMKFGNTYHLKNFSFTVPYDSYQIVNTLSKITEKQANGFVKKRKELYDKTFSETDYFYYDYVFKNYNAESYIESFYSLMAVNEVYLVNPYGVQPTLLGSYGIEDYNYIHNQWQQAENNTSEYLILEKI